MELENLTVKYDVNIINNMHPPTYSEYSSELYMSTSSYLLKIFAVSD
jgi:hypothetical protein